MKGAVVLRVASGAVAGAVAMNGRCSCVASRIRGCCGGCQVDKSAAQHHWSGCSRKGAACMHLLEQRAIRTIVMSALLSQNKSISR